MKQKTYRSRDAIVAHIESEKQKCISIRQEAESLEVDRQNQIKACQKLKPDELDIQRKHISIQKRKIEKLHKRANRIEDAKLPALKRTLAAFDTVPMFGDEQVVLQKL